MKTKSIFGTLIWTAWICATALRAQQVPPPLSPEVEAESRDADNAIGAFQMPSGVRAELFAAEPLLANPVSMFVDDRGRVFVCESFRQDVGVVDNRDFSQQWVDDDLASQSVDDRRKYHLRHLGDDAKKFLEQDDRIKLLVDRDGNGKADESHIFASGFNDLVDGTGAGVLAYQGNVYYTCIPSLYLMRDENRDNQADGRTVLHTGYGVRVAFRGHDLHGLVIGPDGRLYFSIGDRGANVQTADGPIANIESGSVFRCELDGSSLEIFATGLRNPQELAFDDHGNLFTGDNNSDSGDRARWVYVVEGGDSGWRMAYQYLPDRGPFNREKIWHPHHAGQPAYIVPPIANIADGPSGLDYYPGTGFGDRFKDQFLLADFRGTASKSGIRSLRNEPDGAFFKLAEDRQPFWQILATDVQFGPDGAVYVSDWVNGWQGEGRGRIYRFLAEEDQHSPVVSEVRAILASEFVELPAEKLAGYLGHRDRRIRLKAQLELARRGAFDLLARAALDGPSLQQRLHGIWGLGYLTRRNGDVVIQAGKTMMTLANDDSAEIRAQAIGLLGELGKLVPDAERSTALAVLKALDDPHPRVRYFAMLAISKLGLAEAFDGVVAELARNEGRDPILRHGGVMALTEISADDRLQNLKDHPSIHVRLAAVVALRRRESAAVADFLHDVDEAVVAEAARAINDQPIPAAEEALANLIDQSNHNSPVLRRVLNAHFRLGRAENGVALARFAAESPGIHLELRQEALAMLKDWAEPGGRDRVTGIWRPLTSRSADSVRSALSPYLPQFLQCEPPLRLQAAELAVSLGIAEARPLLESIFDDKDQRPVDRAAALAGLVRLPSPRPILERALRDASHEVRAAALAVVRQVLPDQAEVRLSEAASTGHPRERQIAISQLADADEASPGLIRILNDWLNGNLPAEAHLEAFDAAEAHRRDPRVAKLLDAIAARRDPNNPLDAYRGTTHGGDVARGRALFWKRESISCRRCHKVQGEGGEVGPDLTRIALDKSRDYLLEAIVDPNKTIAKGFESATLLDLDGKIYTGVVRQETSDVIVLIDANGREITFDKSDIEARTAAQSAMPADLVKQLTRSELRDLVEYLASLNGEQVAPASQVQ